MKILKFIWKKIDSLLQSIFSLTGALILVQFPQFIAQYIQRLGGHLDESQRMASRYQVQVIIDRAADLKLKYTAIVNAKPLAKLWAFIQNADWEIARATIKDFSPGLTFNELGIFYLITGLLAGLIIYGLIKLIIKLICISVKKITGKKKNRI